MTSTWWLACDRRSPADSPSAPPPRTPTRIPLGFRRSAVSLGQMLEGLAGRANGPRHVSPTVDPVDPHLPGATIDETVRDATWHPGHVLGDQVEPIFPYHRGGFALQDHNRLFDVVRVQRDLRAGRKDGHTGRDLVADGVPLTHQRDSLHARTAVE